jgi:hypothetical protein
MTQKLHVYADPEMPGNTWKTTLPDGSFMFFESKEKAKKFAELYVKDLEKSPKKRKS